MIIKCNLKLLMHLARNVFCKLTPSSHRQTTYGLFPLSIRNSNTAVLTWVIDWETGYASYVVWLCKNRGNRTGHTFKLTIKLYYTCISHSVNMEPESLKLLYGSVINTAIYRLNTKKNISFYVPLSFPACQLLQI